jgi:HAD superfamily hydrolase (TIGR01484 family)
MIKAIVADVDGVIVGKKHGVNFPLPNEKVIEKLKALHAKGVPVVLCTAKFNYAILGIIQQANLRNPHITDAGALIYNPLADKIIKAHVFDKKLAHDIAAACLEKDAYTECYGVEDYFVQTGQVHDFTETRIKILQKPHRAVESLLDHVDQLDVIKFIAFAEKPGDKAKVDAALEPFRDKIHFVWGKHPAMAPAEAGVVTLKGVSKQHATQEVLEYLGISPEDTLGVGDALSDWSFMQLCGYAATIGDDRELQEKAKTKGEGKYFFGPSVDDHGFLAIADHFFV